MQKDTENQIVKFFGTSTSMKASFFAVFMHEYYEISQHGLYHGTEQ